jgi:hypothetical protein
MPIDAHARYVPRPMLDVLERSGKRSGVEVIAPAGCPSGVRFEHGSRERFFEAPLQAPGARIERMHRIGLASEVAVDGCRLFRL